LSIIVPLAGAKVFGKYDMDEGTGKKNIKTFNPLAHLKDVACPLKGFSRL